jgi:PIN domain nuclease of toxin-antitoxin system
MRLLLDTHTFIWFVLNDAQLSRSADALITDPTNDVFVSPATYWEIASIRYRLRLINQ